MSTKLNKKQLLAAEFLAFGETARSVSAKLGIRHETISRWKKIPCFVDMIRDVQLILFQEMIARQTSLLSYSQEAVLNAFKSTETTETFKAKLGIKYLNLYGGASTVNDKMEKFYQLQKKANNDSNYSVKKMFNIIDEVFRLYKISDDLSDKEYRKKVREFINSIDYILKPADDTKF